jgi:hypothetical protein
MKISCKNFLNDYTAQEVIYGPLYDYRRNVRSLSGPMNFFWCPMGHTLHNEDNPRTMQDTNMCIASQLPYGFVATALRFYTNARGQDRYNLLDQGMLKFAVGSKIYSTVAPLAMVPAIFDQFPITPQLLARVDDPSLLLRDYEHALKETLFKIVPIHIECHQSFSVSIDFQELEFSRPITIGVNIDGFPMRNSN